MFKTGWQVSLSAFDKHRAIFLDTMATDIQIFVSFREGVTILQ